MKVMVTMKANPQAEAGRRPSLRLRSQMTRFNEELVESGIMVAEPTLMPFAAPNGLVAGFWVWQVRSMEEAAAWSQLIPQPDDAVTAEVEIRPVLEAGARTEAVRRP